MQTNWEIERELKLVKRSRGRASDDVDDQSMFGCQTLLSVSAKLLFSNHGKYEIESLGQKKLVI
jgi:hypothetical protein